MSMYVQGFISLAGASLTEQSIQTNMVTEVSYWTIHKDKHGKSGLLLDSPYRQTW